MEEFFSLLKEILEADALQKIVFSRSKNKEIKKAEGRVITLSGGRALQIERFTADGKALHENIPYDSALPRLRGICAGFSQINVFTTAGDCEALISKKGACRLTSRISGEFRKREDGKNDRAHRYILDPETCFPFLEKLGVTDSKGRIHDKMRPKFKQINRFVEILSDVYSFLPPEKELIVCDLCCGKSYLTFAVYYYLTAVKKRAVKMYAMDLKSDVISFCRETAKGLGFDGMEFICGDVFTFEPEEKPDLVISLHACDIATDMVLYNALRLKAKVILSTPCCHHEMMRQLRSEPLAFTDKHPLLRQKICDAFTDALRCKRLEAEGYKVTTLELIDPEETPKNVMIKAIRANVPEEKRIKALEEYKAACAFLGVSPYLDKLISGGKE